MIYPITFSIPEEKIVDHPSEKKKLVSSLIPGELGTYTFTSEPEYYAEYQRSLFAMTTRKAGWDCMRHYEILANGCLPIFPFIENCPENTMKILPKSMIVESNSLFLRYFHRKMFTSEEHGQFMDLISRMLEYTRTHLTTRAVAESIRQKLAFPVNSILYLSGNTEPDYLRDLVLHGFKEIMGNACHDYPKISFLYTSDTTPANRLYGNGFSYSRLLDEDTTRDSKRDETLVMDILQKRYDLVVYGSYHRGMPLYEYVSQIYTPDKIVLLCGEDAHPCDSVQWSNRGHPVFVREFDSILNYVSPTEKEG